MGVAQVQGFEWDPNKKGRNIRNRGLDLTIASRIWEGPVLEKVDARHDCGGTRIMAFGKVDGRLMAVLFTRRGSNRRTISARKANRREQRRFEAEIGEDDKPVTN